MDPTKKRKQPDSAFNEDPSSGDGAVSNWRDGDLQDLRLQNRNAIEHGIQEFLNAEMVIKATAEMVEGGIYKEATSEDDYKTRVSDYIQRIPDTPGILQAAPADLNSQMGHLDNSQEQPLAGLPSEGSTTLPPDQQQPQQQQSDPNELQKKLVEEVGDLFYNFS
ncbi:hypothetical protein FCM35_KLT05679 [Carex littledalei]|uniref:Mediator complex subunit 15 KIX domain-containing protein n=1 Tax=Carex littledalei TaxID=544730 RepID=A0A833V8J2_9POAL|nr:hypothetical protein FCM35_KLT05679 [Carex littledalei]